MPFTVSRTHPLLRRFAAFCKRDSGSVTVESVIILPVLFFGLMALFSFFDAYRQQALALRANYAISDYLSRVYKYDRTTFNGLDDLFRYMSKTGEESWIRISVVHCAVEKEKCNDPADRKLTFMKADSAISKGSTAHGNWKFKDNAEMIHYLGGHIPNMYEGEYLFVVETRARYRMMFSANWTGLSERNFHNTVVTRSREYEYLCFPRSGKPCKDPDA